MYRIEWMDVSGLESDEDTFRAPISMSNVGQFRLNKYKKCNR
jgi:hypothetical protein